ncbi:hypothetical protein DFA_08262 [Cavenderia fasciculata]|uniref:Uncharacterized protein n=1 Tax=Cavenderia fasciculata TaxID=261658 RepID=F4Q5L1_CACFS|nr:uncharacterized protein DFA_08262 [Cavenderia fasciculata]EGG17270.1 hypothetical protein DFA_08262 [Cavenderia fasciculata]|eukprot:XP_004355754.1 hypothetical protein DFA_08262 [Cavenderia fasciculata]
MASILNPDFFDHGQDITVWLMRIKDVPTTLNVFDTSDGVYYAVNISSGELISKHRIDLFNGDLVELNGVILPLSAGDDFLLIGGNITDVGESYIPIIWSYNVLSKTIVQKSFIKEKFPQFDYQWSPQIASYDSINNIVYLNADLNGGPVLLKFDYNQQKEDVMTLPGDGWYIQSSYNETTNTCYMGGQNEVANQYAQMVVATYNSVTGDTTTNTIKFDIPDSCYYSTVMYQYNSLFYSALTAGTGYCPGYVFQVDIVGNTTTLIATIPTVDTFPINGGKSFVFDPVNGYLAMVATNYEDFSKLEICMVNLNTYQVDLYAIPNALVLQIRTEDEFLMTLS